MRGGAWDEIAGGVHDDQLGLAGAVVGEPDDLIADRDVLDAAADLLDDAGKIAALAGGKCCGPPLGHGAFANPGLAGIDARGLDADQDLTRAWDRPVDLHDAQDVETAIVVEAHCTRHGRPPRCRSAPIIPEKQKYRQPIGNSPRGVPFRHAFLRAEVQKAAADGDRDRMCPVLCVELRENCPHVVLHRVLADVQPDGNDLVRAAFGDPAQNFDLAFGQRVAVA